MQIINKKTKKPTSAKATEDKQKNNKVYVGLSGGVDSSVAVALLQKDGYEVTGVFIKIWNEKWGPCGWKDDRRDAMKVAMHLDIPFKELDLSDEYEKEVVKYMVREYKAGRTPNPDVMCNSQIKFGEFLKWSLKNGADFIATGHYARLKRETQNPKLKTQNKSKILNSKFKTRLLSGVDCGKDQSYFLWQLKQSQLKYCLFPIGEYKKNKVRELAKKFGLPTAEKKDSQGICFIGKMGMKDFLKKYIKAKSGDVLNLNGDIIGRHDGAVFFTIGQRHGFVITKKGTDDKPYYVVGKDVRENEIIVFNKDLKTKKQKNKKTILINNVNWILNEEPDLDKKYKVRFRHLQELKVCKVKKLKDDEYIINFVKTQENIVSGQSLVIYDGGICLGGGVIK
ncbi:MAG: tRNA 2-thiouridine(34) synthase MnmA [Candidatus Falkowbacteria bacterium]